MILEKIRNNFKKKIMFNNSIASMALEEKNISLHKIIVSLLNNDGHIRKADLKNRLESICKQSYSEHNPKFYVNRLPYLVDPYDRGNVTDRAHSYKTFIEKNLVGEEWLAKHLGVYLIHEKECFSIVPKNTLTHYDKKENYLVHDYYCDGDYYYRVTITIDPIFNYSGTPPEYCLNKIKEKSKQISNMVVIDAIDYDKNSDLEKQKSFKYQQIFYDPIVMIQHSNSYEYVCGWDKNLNLGEMVQNYVGGSGEKNPIIIL